uniref:Fibronectin type-III domain-containing protein n=1 Tax=Mola mola TaxID=94237 RepID=A0A3Q3W598_MOLML
MVGGVCVAVTLLTCVLGGQALDLLRAAAPSGSEYQTVHCWCSSYPNVTLCSWPEPSQSPPKQYVATYSERHIQSVTRECHLIQPGSPSLFQIPASSSSSERLWLCYLPNLKIFTDYIINVTAVHPSVSSTYMSSFMLEDIVKPDPPEDIRVSLNNTNLLVEWSPPSSWANLDVLPLKYHILYQWEIRGILQSVKLGPLERTKLELRGLKSGRPYLFQVCAKDLLDLGECSYWSSAVKITIP